VLPREKNRNTVSKGEPRGVVKGGGRRGDKDQGKTHRQILDSGTARHNCSNKSGRGRGVKLPKILKKAGGTGGE